MHLLFVADGERDHRTVPKLVDRILDTQVGCDFIPWKALRSHPDKESLRWGKGYQRKLTLALLTARNLGHVGVVATLDSDRTKPGERLGLLRVARERDRQVSSLSVIPTALGEAVPYLEAWLADDPKTVKAVLGFPTEKHLPDVLKVNPKAMLNEIIAESDRIEQPIELLSEIAKKLNIERCNHRSDTGLQEFADEVRTELEPLLTA